MFHLIKYPKSNWACHFMERGINYFKLTKKVWYEWENHFLISIFQELRPQPNYSNNFPILSKAKFINNFPHNSTNLQLSTTSNLDSQCYQFRLLFLKVPNSFPLVILIKENVFLILQILANFSITDLQI